MAELARVHEGRLARRGYERGPVREFLVFALGGEHYGVELTRIREIVSPPPITPVPRAKSDVLGVCSVRGLLVTVVDLRKRLRLETPPATRRTRILLAQGDSGEVMGLMVDEVRHVVRLTETEIEVASNVLGGDISEHVLGIGRPAGEPVLVLLDLGSIVST
jgi:purine-binding chemotaxis protein CheW